MKTLHGVNIQLVRSEYLNCHELVISGIAGDGDEAFLTEIVLTEDNIRELVEMLGSRDIRKVKSGF